MELTHGTVLEVLCNLSLRYPEAGYSPEQLAAIADEYHEDLISEGINEELFVHAYKVCRRTNKFFPKVSEIIEIANEEKAQLFRCRQFNRTQIAFSGELSDDEKENNRIEFEKLQSIIRNLSGSLSMKSNV